MVDAGVRCGAGRPARHLAIHVVPDADSRYLRAKLGDQEKALAGPDFEAFVLCDNQPIRSSGNYALLGEPGLQRFEVRSVDIAGNLSDPAIVEREVTCPDEAPVAYTESPSCSTTGGLPLTALPLLWAAFRTRRQSSRPSGRPTSD